MEGNSSTVSGPMFLKSTLLAHAVYDLLPGFPVDERYGICNQLRRAVLSVPANLTEGYARKKPKVFLNHLEIAYGSLMEVKFFLYFSCKRGFIQPKEYMHCWNIIDEVGAMLWRSIEKIESNIERTELS